MQKCGYAILLLSVLLLVTYNTTLFVRLTKQKLQHKHPALIVLSCNMGSLVFVMVRVAHGLAAAVTESHKLSPVTGTFAAKFLLIFFMQLVATLLLIIGGIHSRNLR